MPGGTRPRSRSLELLSGAVSVFLALALAGCCEPGSLRKTPATPQRAEPAESTPALPSQKEPAEAPTAAKGPAITEEIRETREEAVARTRYEGKKPLLELGAPAITPSEAPRRGRVVQEVQYTILAPTAANSLQVEEVVAISDGARLLLPLIRRTATRAQGSHLLRLSFVLPKDLPAGNYRLITSLVLGELKKSVNGSFRVQP